MVKTDILLCGLLCCVYLVIVCFTQFEQQVGANQKALRAVNHHKCGQPHHLFFSSSQNVQNRALYNKIWSSSTGVWGERERNRSFTFGNVDLFLCSWRRLASHFKSVLKFFFKITRTSPAAPNYPFYFKMSWMTENLHRQNRRNQKYLKTKQNITMETETRPLNLFRIFIEQQKKLSASYYTRLYHNGVMMCWAICFLHMVMKKVNKAGL